MHTFSENSSGVPAFLAKLWRLVEDEETNRLIYWSTDGKSFIIQNQAQFARDILPLNYKHNNMASFIRQLNMYGFHKITSLDGGGLKFDRDEMEFSHPYFQRDHPYLLEHIKRKISTTKTTNVDDKSNIKHEIVSKVLSEVKSMKGRQDSLDNRFLSMKQENEALWREVAILRQKHMKQQQIVNKLIQFLVTIVQPQRGGGIGSMGGMGGVKRRYQLMINDIPDASKMRKTSRTSQDGPVIRELTEELLDNYDDELAPSPYVVSPSSFPPQTPTFEIENIDEVDADQIIAEDSDVASVIGGVTNIDENVSGNVYNTADYSTDLIYDINSRKTPIGLITENAGALCTSNDEVDDIPVEELLENVRSRVPDQLSAFIKTENKQPQPLMQQQQNIKTGLNQKLMSNKKQIPGNVTIANAGVNVPVAKRIVKIAPNQLPNHQTMAGDRRVTATGKSLIDAQKLKAVNEIELEPPLMLTDTHTHCYSEQLNTHLDSVQGDLEALKDFLRGGEDYQMDANTLLSNQNDATPKYNSMLSGIGADSIMSVTNKLFNENDVFQQYSLPMNPTNSTQMPDMENRQRAENNNTPQTATGSELISYQQIQQPIDFTDFLNLDENELAMNASDATAAAAMSPALSAHMPINSMQHMPFVNQYFGDLTTPYVKREQFAYPE